MRVLVLGGSGLLGKYLESHLTESDDTPIIRSRSTFPPLDIRKVDDLATQLRELRPDCIINLAAMTNVDECEVNQESAWQVNALGASNVALAAQQTGISLIHVSTDSVFGGSAAPYTEDDPVDPLNAYAVTKFLGERAALARGALVVRTNFLGAGRTSSLAWLFKSLSNGQTIEGYNNVHNAPIGADDLAIALRRLASLSLSGLLHIGGRVGVSKYEMAQYVHESLGSGKVISRPAPTEGVVRRPLDTRLESRRAQALIGEFDGGWKRSVDNAIRMMSEEDT